MRSRSANNGSADISLLTNILQHLQQQSLTWINGEVSDGFGVFLEVVPEQRLVFTNAFTSGWVPAARPALDRGGAEA